MTLVRRLFVGALAILLAACAAASPAPRPGELPFRASDQPPVTVYWRLTEAPGSVRADDVLDVDGYVDRLADAPPWSGWVSTGAAGS